MLLKTWLLLLSVSSIAFAAPANISDDCQKIRNAIAALPFTGGTIQVPEGTYICKSPIILDRNNLKIVGIGQVLFKLADRANSPLIIIGDIHTPPKIVKNVAISNLNLDGNRWSQKFECWGGPCDGGELSVIRNNGVTIRGATNALIRNVHIQGARSGGVVTEKGCRDLVIEGLTSTDNEFDGFAGYETTGSIFSGLRLMQNRAAGISLDIHFNGNIFKDSAIEDNGDVGIFMRDSRNNIFENLTLKNNNNHGIFLAQDADFTTCSIANIFKSVSVIHSRGFGIVLNDNCSGNRFTGTTRLFNNREGCVQDKFAKIVFDGAAICEN